MSEEEKKILLVKARQEGGGFLLPSRSWLRVRGQDALRYLNGQITADLRKLTPGASLQACLLTPKGRLVALVQMMKEDDSFLIETEPSLQEIVLVRLERYIVTDDVILEIISAPAQMHIFGKLSEHPEIQAAPGITIRRLGFPGKDVDVALAASLSLSEQNMLLSTDVVEVLRIEQALPRWNFELTENTLPPEARLDKDSIDYEKGCYLGQEIISRLKSIGHVNRLLFAFRSSEELQRGMEIYSAGEESLLGLLTSVALQYDSGEWIALGYLRRGSENGASLFAKDPSTGISKNIFLNKNHFFPHS